MSHFLKNFLLVVFLLNTPALLRNVVAAETAPCSNKWCARKRYDHLQYKTFPATNNNKKTRIEVEIIIRRTLR